MKISEDLLEAAYKISDGWRCCCTAFRLRETRKFFTVLFGPKDDGLEDKRRESDSWMRYHDEPYTKAYVQDARFMALLFARKEALRRRL